MKTKHYQVKWRGVFWEAEFQPFDPSVGIDGASWFFGEAGRWMDDSGEVYNENGSKLGGEAHLYIDGKFTPLVQDDTDPAYPEFD
jgi:hypothetical protein